MRFRRIRRAFPWRTAALLAILIGGPVLVFATWFVWDIEPLQSYYLLDYWKCSRVVEDARSTTEIQWLMKTSPGRRSKVATSDNVTTGKMGNLSIHLSSGAMKDKWMGLAKSAPDTPSSAQLKDALSSYIYDGRSYTEFITLPFLEGCTLALVFAVVIVLNTRVELWREWKRLWREVVTTDCAYDDPWEAPRIRHGIRRPISAGKWWGKVRSILPDGGTRSSTERTVEKAAFPSVYEGRSLPTSAHFSPVQVVPKNTAQVQSIFPGARGENGAPQEQIAWDESQWID